MAKLMYDGRIDFSGQSDPLYALQSSGTLEREDLLVH